MKRHSGNRRGTLSLALVAALATSAMPVTAQERIDRSPGSISRAIAQEAERLAAEADARPPASRAASIGSGQSSNANNRRAHVKHDAMVGALLGAVVGAVRTP